MPGVSKTAPEVEGHASACDIFFKVGGGCSCSVAKAQRLQQQLDAALELQPNDLRMTNRKLRESNHALALERDALVKQLREEREAKAPVADVRGFQRWPQSFWALERTSLAVSSNVRRR